MKLPIFILLILSLTFSIVEAKRINFYIDGATFRNDESSIIWEMYYSYPDTALRYVKSNGKYTSELLINIVIKSSVKEEVNNSWIVTNKVAQPPSSFKMNLVGQKSFILPQGQYDATIRILDINDSSSSAATSFKIITRKYSENSISISDIELASHIESEKEKSTNWMKIFNKNSLYVIPNPSLEYYGTKPVLKAYVEVYNALKYAPQGYNIQFKVLDALKMEVFNTSNISKPSSDGMAELIELPIDSLSTGVYYLSITVSYPTNQPKDSVSISKKFYFINYLMPPKQHLLYVESESFELSEFSAMSAEMVETEFRMLKLIATPDEIEKYNMLTQLEAKQRFLYLFWKSRDTDLKTPVNEFRLEFQKAVNYANTFFSTGGSRNGWNTDRGRVLLKYGFPTQRDEIPADNINRAYEVWYYDNIQGGVKFYFVDVLGYKNFQLVHSTAVGEMVNQNWFEDYVPYDKSNDSDIRKDKYNGR